MKNVFFCALFIFSFSALSAATNPGLELICLLDAPGVQIEKNAPGTTTSWQLVSFAVVLKNTGDKPVRVGTGVGPALSGFYGTPRYVKAHFGLHQWYWGKEKATQMRSVVDIKPVELLPGEVAVIDGKIRTLAEVELQDIEVIYEVDDFMAKRFDIWGGRLTAKISLPGNGLVKKNEPTSQP